MIFPFALEHTIVAAILQNNEDGFENTIAFFSKSLIYGELKCNIMENQAYALRNALHPFKQYMPQY